MILRLLRISLAPSAVADVAAGACIGAGGAWVLGWRFVPLACASLGVYHGALALNDWADREHDARTRPERPIPSGAVSPNTALGIALVLMAGGLAAAASFGWQVFMGAALLAALASAYDLIGRGPVLGPLLLGLCRAGNVGLGGLAVLSTVPAAWSPRWLVITVVFYGLYVFTLSRLGRMEDGEDSSPLGETPSRLVSLCASLLVGLGFWGMAMHSPLDAGPLAGFALSMVAAVPLRRFFTPWFAAKKEIAWTRSAIPPVMGLLLRRMMVMTAVGTLATGSRDVRAPFVVAALILCGYLLSAQLRKLFPPS